MDSPHQAGDHISYDMLTRAPHYLLTSHFTQHPTRCSGPRESPPHQRADAVLSRRQGWERNDDVYYEFDGLDLLVVPPYTIHQHGGFDDVGAEIYVPETGRIHHIMGLVWREQHKLSEKPTFPDGTEPLYEGEDLVGYRIKRGVLGIKEDIDVHARRGAPAGGGVRGPTGIRFLDRGAAEHVRAVCQADARRGGLLPPGGSCRSRGRQAVGV